MTAGLQIWNASGQLVLDATSRLGRIKGIQQLDGNNGSYPIDLSGGTPFWSFQPDRLYFHISNQTASPIITIDANGVYWTYSSTSGLSYPKTVTGTLIFGVY
ncbi:hypothetical protein LMG27952_03154 [Paraburkholderia hiiakae]|uniref:Uncharacterized protein n=1 Tax=Paraburkholderia hiiakae TaxID=1081782 RepID=A0ABN7HUD8_9BURK|nr:hypothetical protein [Paraburkholderia hiiakae]CAD6536473.1 hypothetical protein LMG27952_03154 [Paraburkholderia hiiakae]